MTNRTDDRETRFATNLAAEIKRLGTIGHVNLQRSIEERTGKSIDRRKLARLAEAEPVRLTLDEIEALDLYLRESGQPLSALIKPMDLPSALVEHGRLTFVIPSRSDSQHVQGRLDISRWDLRALRSVLKFVTGTGRRFDLSIEDVIFRPEPMRSFSWMGKVDEKEEWYHRCLRIQDTSFVILGSPLASAACELFLCRIFGRDEHRFGQDSEASSHPPITFLWPLKEDRARQTKSAFKWNGEEHPLVSAKLREELAQDHTNQLALAVGEDLYVADRSSGDTYGVIVAQAWSDKVVAVAIAGLTGSATFGAASKLNDILAPLPAANGRGDGEVRVAVVKVPVDFREDDPEWRSDKRHVRINEVKVVSVRTWIRGKWSD